MSKFTYKVINARIGKEVGSTVEYDHEPCAEFLVCLERVEATPERKLEVATPATTKKPTPKKQTLNPIYSKLVALCGLFYM